jgi:hypothetical protein
VQNIFETLAFAINGIRKQLIVKQLQRSFAPSLSSHAANVRKFSFLEFSPPIRRADAKSGLAIYRARADKVLGVKVWILLNNGFMFRLTMEAAQQR